MELFSRIKKYLFLLAFVISVTLGIHIVIVYLYDEAELVAERGGTFSIGATGISPSLNPTQYSLDTLNDFVLRFLYRGLLRYNPESKVMEGDLANCDITKNLGEIRCFFKSGGTWSDGTKITIEDALATYSLLAETDVNKKLQSSLSKFAITREDNTLVFRSTNSSIETLQLLTIPVIKKSVTERIRNEGKFQEEAYGGVYKLDKRETDGARMSENIILVSSDSVPKNERYSRIVLKIYSDKDTLVAQKDSLNLVFPGYYDDADFGNRFSKSKILTPDFVGAFLNSEQLNPERRKVISSIIDEVVANSNYKLQYIKNPFFTESTIVTPIWSNLTEALTKVGYLRKKDLPKTSTGTAQTWAIVKQTPVAPIPKTSEVTPAKLPTIKKLLTYIDTPSKETLVSVAYKSEIQVAGTVPKGVSAVFINGYQLKGYREWQTRFLYRARVEIGNLKKGKNTYELAFERNGKRTNEETITIHNGDGFIVPKEPEPTSTNNETNSPSVFSGALNPLAGSGTNSAWDTSQTGSQTAIGTVTLPSQTATGSTASGTTESSGSGVVTNTGAIIPPSEPSEAAPVDDGKLYFKNGNPVTLVVRSLSPKTEISKISKEIVAGLEKVGFTVKFEEIESNSNSLSEAKEYDSKKYDIFITGVNLGYMGTYIMPYFHSGQVQNGFNFSLVRNPGLDILLEELKNKDLTIESRTRQFEKINDILKKESVLVPIGTNPLISFIDKNIQDFIMPTFLPSAIFIDSAILQSYINKSYIVQMDKKSIRGFLNWCNARLISAP